MEVTFGGDGAAVGFGGDDVAVGFGGDGVDADFDGVDAFHDDGGSAAGKSCSEK